MRQRILGFVLICMVLTFTTLPPGSATVSKAEQVASTTVFRETFDGDPTQPEPFSSPRWDISIHSRDRGSWYIPESMLAQHGADCAAPPANHPIEEYSDAVFRCRNHMMTAISAGGFGSIDITPNHMVDFSQGEATIRFDVSTLATSPRDSLHIWITPFDDNLVTPLINGNARNGIRIEMDTNSQDSPIFRVWAIRNFKEQFLEPDGGWVSYSSFLTPSATRRDTFEIRLSRDHVRFGMPQYNFWWINQTVPDLGWDRGVVQFGHSSYNPTKCEGSCSANTWHWDNIEISPAQPFTQIRGQQRYANAEQPQVTFGQPAPEGAKLRFAAIRDQLEISTDGGKSWQAVRLQGQGMPLAQVYEFNSYWMPIPAGTTAVKFRHLGNDGDWFIRDIAIWQSDFVDPIIAPSPLTKRAYLPFLYR